MPTYTETPLQRQDRVRSHYGVHEDGMPVGAEYHSTVDHTDQYSLAEVAAAGGHISRLRVLQERGRCDISYCHATLADGRTVPVRFDHINTMCVLRRELKGELIAEAKAQGVYAKALGLLDEGNWAVLYA